MDSILSDLNVSFQIGGSWIRKNSVELARKHPDRFRLGRQQEIAKIHVQWFQVAGGWTGKNLVELARTPEFLRIQLQQAVSYQANLERLTSKI
jgi:hypothetical protein